MRIGLLDFPERLSIPERDLVKEAAKSVGWPLYEGMHIPTNPKP